MQASARRGISYPVASRTDAPDIPLHFTNLINAIDIDTPFYTGTEAARPLASARVQGSWYYASDSGALYFNNGASWLGLAPLASPALTGNPTAPTQAGTDNSTRLATTAFVRQASSPPGVVNAYAAAAIPSGWLLCDGSAVSRTTYAALFAVIGTTFGAGDGVNTFNLPNLQGRIPVGKNAGTFVTLGAVGGEETHALNISELAAHDHGGVTGATSAGTPAGTLSSDSAGTPAGTITATSAGTPAGTISNDSAGTPAGSISSNSAGTPAGSVHSAFSGSGGAVASNHIQTAGTGLLAGDANAGDVLLTNTFTGTAMAAHTHTFTGTALGLHSHTFTGIAMGTHTHTFTGSALGTHSHTFTGTAMATHTHSIPSQGGGGGHNNLQPYLVLNYIIKT